MTESVATPIVSNTKIARGRAAERMRRSRQRRRDGLRMTGADVARFGTAAPSEEGAPGAPRTTVDVNGQRVADTHGPVPTAEAIRNAQTRAEPITTPPPEPAPAATQPERDDLLHLRLAEYLADPAAGHRRPRGTDDHDGYADATPALISPATPLVGALIERLAV